MKHIELKDGIVEKNWFSGECEIIRQYDVCKCGDYRYQHEGGTGKCKLTDNASHGGVPCLRFRLFAKATEIPRTKEV